MRGDNDDTLNLRSMSSKNSIIPKPKLNVLNEVCHIQERLFVCLFVLSFYGPANS